MRNGTRKAWALAAILITAPAWAQDMPDIGFESVGRGRPLAASVHDQQIVGPMWNRQPGQPRTDAPLELNGFRPADLPDDVEPLPRDIFTSDDFYVDK
jgi:hypothetical protein